MKKTSLTAAVLYFVVAIDVLGQASSQSEEYLWPTDASTYLTSAFCEYRERRFHAGIDVKTWGRVGYKVFAIRSGHVSRISVSPYGYGKALYVKLDTGETALYAHLSGYSKEIEEFVDAEQQRVGRYRLNVYPKPGQFPVRQGDVIAFTGQTGIGAPHLHFEIRDAKNRPTNPLAKGYQLPDRVSPIVTKVGLTPLDAAGQIDGDFKPIILSPKWSKPGIYEIDEVPTIWGNVGLAIACYDKDSNSANAFGLYSFKLYVDDVLEFNYQFDRLAFQENQMVELERDYRLYRRKFGRFHKLYKDKHNARSHYRPNSTWAGALRSASLEASPSLHSEISGTQFAQGAASLFPGTHEYRIEVADFFGNVSAVFGKFMVGEAFPIMPVITESPEGQLHLENVLTYDLRKLQRLSTTVLRGTNWQPLRLDFSSIIESAEEKGGEGSVSDEASENEGDPVVLLRSAPTNPLIMKLVARDQYDIDSFPFYYVRADGLQPTPPTLTVKYDFYSDYVRLEILSNNVLGAVPRLVLHPNHSDSLLIPLNQLDLKKYVARIPFAKLRGANHELAIRGVDAAGGSFSHLEDFEAKKVNAGHEAQLMSDDGNCKVTFWSGSLYEPIYGSVTTDSLSRRESIMVGAIYHAEPQDVPLDAGAKVHLIYPEDEAEPDKLGVYYKTGRGRWAFIDNELDQANRLVSAKVLSLEKFVLAKDVVPPEISAISPRNQSHISSATPRITVNIRDAQSGIKSENEIVIRLDGQKLIAEYDPERDRIFYQVRTPLTKGRHEISVWAQDRCRNDISRTSVFWVD